MKRKRNYEHVVVNVKYLPIVKDLFEVEQKKRERKKTQHEEKLNKI